MERIRKQGNPILPPLAVSDEDLPAIEIDVLHPEPGALEDAQTRPVEEGRHEPWCAVEALEDRGHSERVRTTGSRAGRRACTRSSSHPSSIFNTLRYRKRIALSAWFWVDALTFRSTARWDRKAHPVESHIAANPPDVGALRSPAVAVDANGRTHLIDEEWRLRRDLDRGNRHGRFDPRNCRAGGSGGYWGSASTRARASTSRAYRGLAGTGASVPALRAFRCPITPSITW